ncbi:uncharacterized protein LOC136040837 isoform X2 [Artemia franciscana]|uniref:uncharacterized protein LOC136040837 isoform X2 n=1 Tax=Artemia franciscana TaxID=6661 RepID=UPI0032DBE354
MLVNWLLIELDEVNYQRRSLVQLKIRQPIINFYTMLLHAGVIRPVEDGNINRVDMDFEESFLRDWAKSKTLTQKANRGRGCSLHIRNKRNKQRHEPAGRTR